MTDKQKIEQALSLVKKVRLPNGKWHVKGSLDLSNIKLTSLKDLNVEIVDGDFCVDNNKLTALVGAPTEVGVNFMCQNNDLTSLEGAPREVGGSFFCYCNNKLPSLEGAPREVGGGFNCSYNSLTSLKGCPEKVGVSFSCHKNSLLTSLEGAPKEVGGSFMCDDKFKETEEYKDLMKTYETIKALDSL